MGRVKKTLKWGACLFGFAFLGIQFIPYGTNHTNPPVRAEPVWPNAEVRSLAKRACFDCHSNETQWPWYSYVAPMSWMVQHDVDEGRERFNLSDWKAPASRLHDSVKVVLDRGEMPPPPYVLLHGEAKLRASEVDTLRDALERIFDERGNRRGDEVRGGGEIESRGRNRRGRDRDRDVDLPVTASPVTVSPDTTSSVTAAPIVATAVAETQPSEVTTTKTPLDDAPKPNAPQPILEQAPVPANASTEAAGERTPIAQPLVPAHAAEPLGEAGAEENEEGGAEQSGRRRRRGGRNEIRTEERVEQREGGVRIDRRTEERVDPSRGIPVVSPPAPIVIPGGPVIPGPVVQPPAAEEEEGGGGRRRRNRGGRHGGRDRDRD